MKTSAYYILISGGLQTSQTLFTDGEHLQCIANIWKDSLIFPSYAAGLSLIVLIVNFARSYKSLWRLALL
ncbi:hypothetical protein A0H81_13661 [Grifola frondosa]|uniref:Uncharacterized protein n=1 Tax=Grifola frondosa TaxID=5627 RepID=A0A1C7LNY3_GRIFR|nr:hypothetical protein A0H81_13661 [Grifola frondosa]